MRARVWTGVAGAVLASLLAGRAMADTGTNELTVSQSFQLRAQVVSGCLLGTGASDVTTFGTLSFGQFASLPGDVNRVTTAGTGSIVLQCTPGMAVSIALNTGLNATATVTAGRYLANGSERLRYQLYQDAAYNTVWGDATNGGTALSVTFPSSGVAQTYPVYARLFAVTPMPSAGLYSDTVTVTITY
ncbi:Csu type fimbrial protein [Pseudomonas mangiferae]|nr:spore coat U domain-containing protein [Pseudomonas mangiferae]